MSSFSPDFDGSRCSDFSSPSPRSPCSSSSSPSTSSGFRGQPYYTSRKSGGDRFIPCRRTTNFHLAHYLIQQHAIGRSAVGVVSKSMKGTPHRILSFNNTPARGTNMNSLGSPFSRSQRKRPKIPPNSRVFDTPGLMNDSYLNVLDWSSKNQVAWAVEDGVHLLDVASGKYNAILHLNDDFVGYISAVTWSPQGNHIAVGLDDGDVELWDAEVGECLQLRSGHQSRVQSLSWSNDVLVSGTRLGNIRYDDMRTKKYVAANKAHRGEVCGLRWDVPQTGYSSRYIASGGNDKLVKIWDPAASFTKPLYTFEKHQSAVKALAWCPWERHLLATGGANNDRSICFWNCRNGSFLNSVQTESPVSSIVWSKEYKELVSGHGLDRNQLIVWKYPTMTKLAELEGHTERVLELAASPDGSTVLSSSADETMRFWNCFEVDKASKAAKAKMQAKRLAKKSKRSKLRMDIIR